MTPRRVAGADWPRILCPALGCLPPSTPPRRDERVLFVPWRSTGCLDREPLSSFPALTAAPATDYREVRIGDEDFDTVVFDAADAIRPTLIFFNLQGPALSPEFICDLRRAGDPSCVIVQWDGDQVFKPRDEVRRWFVNNGRACDATLLVNTQEPTEYAELGVRHPGFLECFGVDGGIWRPQPPTPGTPPIVCLASYWPQYDAKYGRRERIFAAVAAAFPDQFAVYGENRGRAHAPFPTRPFLRPHEEAGVYSAARASLAISNCNDLPRYTSNRLFYALASGGVV